MCFDTLGKDEQGDIDLGVYNCQSGSSAFQRFSLSYKNELRLEDTCCYADNVPGSNVKMKNCNENEYQKWHHVKVITILTYVK